VLGVMVVAVAVESLTVPTTETVAPVLRPATVPLVTVVADVMA
jgi:hypothetical protein